MELEFKRDFEAAAAQWERFWRGENTRPAVSAVLPKPDVTPVEKPGYASGPGATRPGRPSSRFLARVRGRHPG